MVTLLLLLASADPVVVYSERSDFSTVMVVDEGPLRTLRFDSEDGDIQSVIDLRDPRAVPMEYLRVATGALAFTKLRSSALLIGLGGGAFPTLLHRHIPEMTIDVVEIDPVVVRVAERWFGFKQDERLRVFVDDGARFVMRTERRYDFIFLDAYSADGVPEALSGVAFFEAVRVLLAPGGVVAANVAFSREGEERALVSRMARVFGSCTLLRGRERGNVIVVAAAPPPAELRRSLAELNVAFSLPFHAARAVHTSEPCLRPSGSLPARR